MPRSMAVMIRSPNHLDDLILIITLIVLPVFRLPALLSRHVVVNMRVPHMRSFRSELAPSRCLHILHPLRLICTIVLMLHRQRPRQPPPLTRIQMPECPSRVFSKRPQPVRRLLFHLHLALAPWWPRLPLRTKGSNTLGKATRLQWQ